MSRIFRAHDAQAGLFAKLILYYKVAWKVDMSQFKLAGVNCIVGVLFEICDCE